MGFAEDLGAIIKFRPQVTINTNRISKRGKRLADGIEIRFGKNKPTEEVRELLKKHGFQFNERDVQDKKWWAYLNEERKAFAEDFANQEIDVDDTQYEKLFFWAQVKSAQEYEKLTYYTEFMVIGTPPEFYNNKTQLENAYDSDMLIAERQLKFKKFYNKPIDGEGQPDPAEEPEESEESSEIVSNNQEQRLVIAENLQKAAEKLDKPILEKLNNPVHKQNPTRKRKEYAARLLEEAAQLTAVKAILLLLAKAHRDNTIENYPQLKGIRIANDIELLSRVKKGEFSQSYAAGTFERNKHSFYRLGLKSISDWEKAVDQIIALAAKYAEENGIDSGTNSIEIAKKINALKGMRIPGFFPSPPQMVDEVLQLADIQDGDKVLEPSAGKGDILDGIRNAFPSFKLTLEACEINYNLREILQLKGYNLVANDFTAYNPSYQYDKIIMNPPFEKGQDIDHVLHAYKMLKPGGRLVAIMGEGAFFRQYNKEKNFRKFLADRHAYVSDTYEGAFLNSFAPTGIRTRIIQLEKPLNDNSSLPSQSHEDNTELLELEALAELELVKLRVELARKKKPAQLKGWSLEKDWDVLNFK